MEYNRSSFKNAGFSTVRKSPVDSRGELSVDAVVVLQTLEIEGCSCSELLIKQWEMDRDLYWQNGSWAFT